MQIYLSLRKEWFTRYHATFSLTSYRPGAYLIRSHVNGSVNIDALDQCFPSILSLPDWSDNYHCQYRCQLQRPLPVHSIQAKVLPSSTSSWQSLCIANPPVPCVFRNKNGIPYTKTTTATTRNMVLWAGSWAPGQQPITWKIYWPLQKHEQDFKVKLFYIQGLYSKMTLQVGRHYIFGIASEKANDGV